VSINEGRESLSVGLVFHEQRFRIESLAPAIRVDEALLDWHDRLELRAQSTPDRSGHTCGSRTARPLSSNAGPIPRRVVPGTQAALEFLFEAVQDLVVRPSRDAPVADAKVRDGMTPSPRLVDLFQELARVR